MNGTPSKERAWQLFDFGQPLKPDTWYRLRTEADFGTRRFRRFTVGGHDLAKSLDLSDLKLDYPNYMPFSDRAMSLYVRAMRGRSVINPNAPFHGKSVICFDDASSGPIAADGRDIWSGTKRCSTESGRRSPAADKSSGWLTPALSDVLFAEHEPTLSEDGHGMPMAKRWLRRPAPVCDRRCCALKRS